jgi:hypothetical protein
VCRNVRGDLPSAARTSHIDLNAVRVSQIERLTGRGYVWLASRPSEAHSRRVELRANQRQWTPSSDNQSRRAAAPVQRVGPADFCNRLSQNRLRRLRTRVQFPPPSGAYVERNHGERTGCRRCHRSEFFSMPGRSTPNAAVQRTAEKSCQNRHSVAILSYPTKGISRRCA